MDKEVFDIRTRIQILNDHIKDLRIEKNYIKLRCDNSEKEYADCEEARFIYINEKIKVLELKSRQLDIFAESLTQDRRERELKAKRKK